MAVQRDYGTHQVKGALPNALLFNQGNSYFIDPAKGSSGYGGRTMKRPKASIADGYALLEAGQNDALYYLNGATSLTWGVATTTWSKSYTHWWGTGAPTVVGQRSRIFNDGNAAYPLITISGDGNSFGNMYWADGTEHAEARCADITGHRNYFYRIHFAGPQHATGTAGTLSCSVKITGRENTFEECMFGVDTTKRTGDNAVVFFDGPQCKRNYFKRCIFVSWAETNTYPMIEVVDTAGADRWLYFEDCLFYNFWTNHGDKLLSVFTIPGSPMTHDIILKNCMVVGAVEWEENDRGQIWVDNLNGAATTGIGLAPAV